jgi:osmotically-inducible protein OsmY
MIKAEIVQSLAEYAGTAERWDVTANQGVIDLRGQFKNEGEQKIVRTLAGQVPGVLRVHTRRHRWG